MIAGTLEIQMMANMVHLVEGIKVAQQKVDAGMAAIQRSVDMAGRALGGLAAAFSVAKVIEYADAWGQLSSRMTQATGSVQAGEAAMKRLMDVSNRVYKPIADTAELFIRTSESLKQMGYTTGQTVAMVETLSYGLTVSSASADKTKSVIDAWSKSLLQGKMTMGEYQTVISGAPALQKALADALGVTIAGLQEMVGKGQLTAEKLMLITSQMQELGKQADAMPATVADAWTKLTNSLTAWAGEANKGTGATKLLVEALSIMADNIGPIVTMLTTLVALAVAQWLGTVAAAAGVAGGAFGLAAAAVKGFFAAMGPLGWAVLGIGAAVAAWQAFGNKAKDAGEAAQAAASATDGAAQKMLSGLTPTIDALIKKYDDLITKQREALGLAPSTVSALNSEYEQVANKLRDAGKMLSDINTRSGKFTGMSGTELDRERNAALEALATLTRQQIELDGKAAEARKNAVAQYVQDTGRMTEAQRQAADLAKENAKYQEALALAEGNAAQTAQVNAAHQAAVGEIRAKYSKASVQASKQEDESYRSLIASIQDKITAQKLEMQTGEKLTEGERMLVKLDADRAAGKLKLTDAHYATIKAGLEELTALEMQAQAREELLKAQKKFEAERDKEIQAKAAEIIAIHDKAQAIEDEIASYGLGAEAIAQATIERMEERKEILKRQGASADLIAQIDEEIAARGRLARATDVKKGLDKEASEQKRMLKELDDYLDPAKAKGFGDALASAFEGAGNALAGLVGALERYGQKEAELAKMRKNLAAELDPDARMQKEMQLAEMTARAQIQSYSSMTGAAKGFFKEGSTGYKSMQKAEQAFRAAELAMAVKNMVIKTGLLGGEVAAAVGAQATMTGISNAGEAARMPAKIAGVFASFMSMMGPFGIPAAVAALAAVGIAARGSSGGNALAPTNEGKGTVFGDKDAKSESIGRTIELLEGISTFAGIENTYAAKMLMSLRSIEQQIGGFTNVILRAGGIEGAAAGIKTGTKGYGIANTLDFLGLDKVMGKLFNTKTTITGQGIYANDATLAQIAAGGLDAGYYADVNKKTKFLGITVSDKNKTNKTADDEVSRQISMILTGFADSIMATAPVLGVSLDTIDARLQDFVVSIGRIDLKDLKGDEIQEKLNAVFGAAGDDIARAALPGLEHLQRVGEGYYETLTRAAVTLSSVNQMFDTLNAALYESSVSGAEAAIGLSDFFGGLETMGSAVESYYEAFYSSTERGVTMVRQLTAVFGDLGMQVPLSRQAFRALVDAQDLTTEAGRKLYAQLVTLAPAFDSMVESVMGAFGLSAGKLTETFVEGLIKGNASAAGQEVANQIVEGIEQTMLTTASGQIFDIVSTGIIAPFLGALANGATVAEALAQANIAKVVEQATQTAQAFAAIWNDPSFKTAIESIRTTVGGALGAAGTALQYSPRYIQPSRDAADAAAKAADEAKKKWEEVWKTLRSDREGAEIDLLRAMGQEEAALARERARAIEGMDAEQAAYWDGTRAILQQVAALQVLNGLRDEEALLQIALMRAVGQEESALAREREIAIRGLSDEQIALWDGNRAIERRIEALNKEREAAEALAQELPALLERFQTPEQRQASGYDRIAADLGRAGIPGLTGADFAGASIDQIVAAAAAIYSLGDTSNETRLALVRAVSGLKDLKDSAAELADQNVDRAMQALERAVAAQRKIAEEAVQETRAVFDAAKAGARALFGEVEAVRRYNLQTGGDYIAQALSAAKLTGYLPDSKELAEAIEGVTQGLQGEVYATQADADFQRLVVANRLKGLEAISGDQLTENEKQLKALDGILDNARAQIDALRGIDSSVMSVEAAVRALGDALAAADAAKKSNELGKMPAKAGASPDMPGWSNWGQGDWTVSAGGGFVYDGATGMLYSESAGTSSTSELRREAEALLNAGNEQAVYDAIKGSGFSLEQADKVLGLPPGAAEDWAKANGYPIFHAGTSYVPRTGLALLEQGEAVVPKQFNPAVFQQGGNTERLERLVEGMAEEIRVLRGQLDENNRQARRTADAVNGRPEAPMLVEQA